MPGEAPGNINGGEPVKPNQDMTLGLIFIATGLFALYIATDYPMGTLARMGPGYLPSVVSILLAGIGAVLVIRTWFMASPAVERWPMKAIILITVAIVLFGATVKGLGMPAAVLILVLVAASSSIRFKLSARSVAGAVVFSVACTVVFVTLLRMPMPIVGSWLQPFTF